MFEQRSISAPSHKSIERKTQNSQMILPGKRFIRRHDFTPSIRLHIAFTALMARACGTWGKVTEINSKRFDQLVRSA